MEPTNSSNPNIFSSQDGATPDVRSLVYGFLGARDLTILSSVNHKFREEAGDNKFFTKAANAQRKPYTNTLNKIAKLEENLSKVKKTYEDYIQTIQEVNGSLKTQLENEKQTLAGRVVKFIKKLFSSESSIYKFFLEKFPPLQQTKNKQEKITNLLEDTTNHIKHSRHRQTKITDNINREINTLNKDLLNIRDRYQNFLKRIKERKNAYEIFNGHKNYENLPILKVAKPSSIVPEDMTAPIMRGTDFNGLWFFCVKAQKGTETVVQTFFESSPQTGSWQASDRSTQIIEAASFNLRDLNEEGNSASNLKALIHNRSYNGWKLVE